MGQVVEKAQSVLLVLRSAGRVFLMQIGALASSFFVSIMLAKLLGATQYGEYQVILAYTGLLGALVALGQAEVVERRIAEYLTKGKIKSATRSVSVAMRIILIIACIMFILLFLSNYVFGISNFGMLLALAITIPISAQSQVFGAALRGAKMVVVGSVAPIIEIFTLLTALLIFFTSSDQNLTVEKAVGLFVCIRIFALVVSWILFLTFFPRHREKTRKSALMNIPRRQLWLHLKVGLPLMAMGLLLGVNSQADIIMLGQMRPLEEAGAYHAATRLSNLLTFGLTAMIVPLRPRIATLWTERNLVDLQELITRTGRIVFIISAPLVLIFFIFAGQILSAAFGDEFGMGGASLSILSVAQLLNIACGPVMAILIMCRQERIATLGVFVSTVLNISLNFVLIPLYGLTGAAIATGIRIVVWNLFLLSITVRRIKINPSIISVQLKNTSSR